MAVETLRIKESALGEIFEAAARADRNECMGLLAAERGKEQVCAAYLMPARATPTRAVASPVDLKRAAEALAEHGLVPQGLFHSHGRSPVYTSATDAATIQRLLPAMAPANLFWSRRAVAQPIVRAGDEALLTLGDGTELRFELHGPKLGENGFGAAAWRSIDVRFDRSGETARAIIEPPHLMLVGERCELRLEFPDDATLVCQRTDQSRVLREASLFSLIVNTHRDACAQLFHIYDIDGRTFSEVGDCVIEAIPKEAGESRLLGMVS